ncbi:DIBOA-glucoside dioxygenase BX6-like isoform X2 [Triticum dicoccoides]|uniref:DIBOA-glucoside dioxygenase BX6-like isoform X2 n=1 Tax=Triticum dicoccoides TaxID=85692 RepID=UPI00188E6305|nr:DIBOA-glucoside dioxygenase BX6-like isoform X2 [Triticum dicoccoides]XP_044319142.1 DIBOA-glucoside dioxygenase BX6-like isoform X2 [Triticum aestivum]
MASHTLTHLTCPVKIMPIVTEAVLAVASSDGFDRRRELQEFDDTKAGVKGLVDSGTKSIPAIFHHPPCSLPQGQERVTSATGTDAAVPVIDLLAAPREEVVGLVRAAAETAGFFQVVNHGVPGQAMAAVLAAVRRFNEEPAEAKRPYYTRDTTTGKVRFYSNLDLFQSPAACWRDTIFCDMAPEPPLPEELPEALRSMRCGCSSCSRSPSGWPATTWSARWAAGRASRWPATTTRRARSRTSRSATAGTPTRLSSPSSCRTPWAACRCFSTTEAAAGAGWTSLPCPAHSSSTSATFFSSSATAGSGAWSTEFWPTKARTRQGSPWRLSSTWGGL